MTIEVITRNLTRSPDEDEPLPPLLLELEQQAMSLRELIAVTVTEQINELAARQAVEPANASIEVSRHYLLSGTIVGDVPSVDAAITNALNAFEANRYVVLVDRAQIENLDDLVQIPAGTRVTFLRLIPLKGG